MGNHLWGDTPAMDTPHLVALPEHVDVHARILGDSRIAMPMTFKVSRLVSHVLSKRIQRGIIILASGDMIVHDTCRAAARLTPGYPLMFR